MTEVAGQNGLHAGKRRHLRLGTGDLDLIPASRPVSIEKEVFPALLSGGGKLGGCATGSGFFVDIGTPEGYQAFREYQKERRL